MGRKWVKGLLLKWPDDHRYLATCRVIRVQLNPMHVIISVYRVKFLDFLIYLVIQMNSTQLR